MVSADWVEEPDDFDVVVVVLFAVVVVVDFRVVVVEPFGCGFEVVAVVDVARSDPAGAVVVVGAAAAAAPKVPGVAPERGSVLVGGAGPGDDVDSAEGAGAASVGGDGGAVVSGVGATGEATSSAEAVTDRAA